MTTIRRIVTSKIDGNDSNANNTDEIRPFGETAFCLDTEQNNALTLMMFNGVRTHRRSKILRPGVFYGSNENSSDGNGFDTIKLIPDAALDFDSEYTNDQYIIIEPTGGEPGHVHIRSGGTMDQSTADLFLGGELNHVKVSDTNDTVIISTQDFGNTTNSWAFDYDGNLTLPHNGVIKDSSNNIQLAVSSAYIPLPSWLTVVDNTAHLPTLNKDYGWDANGVWFNNGTIGGGDEGSTEGTSYPIRTTTPIAASEGVIIEVAFVVNDEGADFGIGIWETGTNPNWAWSGLASYTGGNRIGAQYNGTTPELHGITGTGLASTFNLPVVPTTYRARLTISPPSEGSIIVTLETLNFNGTVLDTITYEEQAFTTSYTIGFAADQDTVGIRTYMQDLTIGYANNQIISTDSLFQYNSVPNVSSFTFADNVVSSAGKDMRFKTTRIGFDIDADFDVESADDVFIEASGNDMRLSAANIVEIVSSISTMYPDVWLGEEQDFIGTWDANTLTIVVPNGPTTLMTLLDYYENSTDAIWIKTANGYVETVNSSLATKTAGPGETTMFEITTAATSPGVNSEVLMLKLHDSINTVPEDGHTWTFEKDGKLSFPNGGAIEPVGMGWIGLTNGTSGNPVSVLSKNADGFGRSGVNLYNSDTYGTVDITTTFAPGTPDGGSINTSFSSGNWDVNPLLALNTTGGSGTGLTVDVTVDVSGYASSVDVVNPGNGYRDGETITVTSGSSNATFVITVQEYNYQWTFDELGKTTLPGAIQGNVKSNTYVDTVINLDVNATINKLTPTGSGNNYYLADGVEGQIMYIACATGGETATEGTLLDLAHARWTNGAGVVNEQTDAGGWLPFHGSSGGSTILTLAFIDGHWNLPHWYFD